MEPINVRVAAKWQETHDTITFLLESVGEPLPTCTAGQFITLLVTHYGREVRRSFSLSSSPSDDFYGITVKRKPNGEISRYLQDHIEVGDQLRVLPPSGRFTLFSEPGTARDIGFMAAGSGIVPILPLVKQGLVQEPHAHVWLIDQNHSESDIIFSDAWLELKALYGDRFTLLHFLSSPEGTQASSRRLTNENLENFVRLLLRFSPSDALFYCCGPEPFMRMAHYTIRLLGFRDDQFRQEHFTIPPVSRVPLLSDHPLLSGHHPKTVRLHLGSHTHTFTVTYPQNILQAALDHHVPLPYSCRGGRCSTCALHCKSGNVIMSINDVLTEKDLQEGWILTCTGYAATDLELEG